MHLLYLILNRRSDVVFDPVYTRISRPGKQGGSTIFSFFHFFRIKNFKITGNLKINPNEICVILSRTRTPNLIEENHEIRIPRSIAPPHRPHRSRQPPDPFSPARPGKRSIGDDSSNHPRGPHRRRRQRQRHLCQRSGRPPHRLQRRLHDRAHPG